MSGSLQQAPMLAPGPQSMPQGNPGIQGPQPPQMPQGVNNQQLAQRTAAANMPRNPSVPMPGGMPPQGMPPGARPGMPGMPPGAMPPQQPAPPQPLRPQMSSAMGGIPSGVAPQNRPPIPPNPAQAAGMAQKTSNDPSQRKMSPAEMAKMGRFGDQLIAHLTPGEIVIPTQVQTPELLIQLAKAFDAKGGHIQQYVAGVKGQRINPNTGAPEFSWLQDILALGATAAVTYGAGAAVGAAGALGEGASAAADAGDTAATLGAGDTSLATSGEGISAGLNSGTDAQIAADANAAGASTATGADASTAAGGAGLDLAPDAVGGSGQATQGGLGAFQQAAGAGTNASPGAPAFSDPSATGASATQQQQALVQLAQQNPQAAQAMLGQSNPQMAQALSGGQQIGGSDAGGDFGNATSNSAAGSPPSTGGSVPSNTPAPGNAGSAGDPNAAGGFDTATNTPSPAAPQQSGLSSFANSVGNWFKQNPGTALKLGISGGAGLAAAISAASQKKSPTAQQNVNAGMQPFNPQAQQNPGQTVLHNGTSNIPSFAGYNPIASVTGSPYNFYNPSANTTTG